MNKINEQFVPFEIALRLKKIGFDEPCLGYYHTNTQGDMDHTTIEGLLEFFGSNYQYMPRNSYVHHSMICAPLWQQVFDWLREKHDLHIKVTRDGGWWSFCSHDLSNEDDSSPESNTNKKVLTIGGSEISDFYSQREKAILNILKYLEK